MAQRKRKRRKGSKKLSIKVSDGKLCGNTLWTVTTGKLTRPQGRPGKVAPLFKAVGEKIPYSFLADVRDYLKSKEIPRVGVYIAHDSMGYPRYIGRGNIFSRLNIRRNRQVLELAYFSFFVVADKVHEREVETIMIRAAGPLLDFNERKVRTDIGAGSVRDFEPGTRYVQRQYKKGVRKPGRRKRKRS